MQELLDMYAVAIKAATDEQVIEHLTNLVNDAATLAEAVKVVVEQAKARLQPAAV